MAEDTHQELGLSTSPPETHRQLPPGVVLTFAVDPTTGVEVDPGNQLDSFPIEQVVDIKAEVRFWADGARVSYDHYRVIIETIQIGKRLSTFDDLHEQLAGLLARYASKIPEENPDGPTHA